jgi:hypothetical protein
MMKQYLSDLSWMLREQSRLLSSEGMYDEAAAAFEQADRLKHHAADHAACRTLMPSAEYDHCNMAIINDSKDRITDRGNWASDANWMHR